MKPVLIFFIVLLPAILFARIDNTGQDVVKIPVGVIDPQIVDVGYSGKEILKYDVSWTGGIKIGELHLEVNRLEEGEDGFEIRSFITTKGGAVHLFYPISDLHVTKVRGIKKLPYHYEVWQKEGYSYTAHRVLEYDQSNGFIRYMKNGKLEGEYVVEGEVNNEFSSFFNSRLMDFSKSTAFLVPTFADKERVEVAVYPRGIKEIHNTVIGDVSAVEIMPVMEFKGLYDKKGDTVIWYTNDKCRVPVKINSKIAIGSLTAKLKEYENSSCDIYPAVRKK
ncbi:MAG: hypothetical protein ACI8ZB_002116 [Desulforhopalus sp.]|jgi:hypothetical protein